MICHADSDSATKSYLPILQPSKMAVKCGPSNAVSGDLLDDVIKWKHYPRYWPFTGSRYCLNQQLSKQWRRGDLRRHRVHCGVMGLLPDT